MVSWWLLKCESNIYTCLSHGLGMVCDTCHRFKVCFPWPIVRDDFVLLLLCIFLFFLLHTLFHFPSKVSLNAYGTDGLVILIPSTFVWEILSLLLLWVTALLDRVLGLILFVCLCVLFWIYFSSLCTSTVSSHSITDCKFLQKSLPKHLFSSPFDFFAPPHY